MTFAGCLLYKTFHTLFCLGLAAHQGPSGAVHVTALLWHSPGQGMSFP